MAKEKKTEKEVAAKYGLQPPEYLGFDYDPESIDDDLYRDVRFKPSGYFDDWAGDDGPPKGHVESTPHGRSIIERREILKDVEVIRVGDKLAIVDGRDRRFLARKYGIPCRMVVLNGLKEEMIRDYIVEVNSARGKPSKEEEEAQVKNYLENEESEVKLAGEKGQTKLRSVFNKVAVICGVSHARAKRIERDNFKERWAAACQGEQRLAINGNKFKVKVPEMKIDGLLAKLKEESNSTESAKALAIGLIRKDLTKYKDLLDQSYTATVVAEVDRVEEQINRERQKRAEQEEDADDSDKDDAEEDADDSDKDDAEEDADKIDEEDAEEDADDSTEENADNNDDAENLTRKVTEPAVHKPIPERVEKYARDYEGAKALLDEVGAPDQIDWARPQGVRALLGVALAERWLNKTTGAGPDDDHLDVFVKARKVLFVAERRLLGEKPSGTPPTEPVSEPRHGGPQDEIACNEHE